MPEAHFLGRETSPTPLAGALVDQVRDLADRGADPRGVVSARHGTRCSVSVAGADLTELGGDDFVDVVEYDPHGDRLLLVGEHEPDPLALVHALVYQARDEVGAVLQVEVPAAHPDHDALPSASGKGTTLDAAMQVLEALRDGPAVSLADRYLVGVGAGPADAGDALRDALALADDPGEAPQGGGDGAGEHEPDPAAGTDGEGSP